MYLMCCMRPYSIFKSNKVLILQGRNRPSQVKALRKHTKFSIKFSLKYNKRHQMIHGLHPLVRAIEFKWFGNFHFGKGEYISQYRWKLNLEV